MNFDESDDEELPTHADSTTDSINVENNSSTFSTELTDRTALLPEPPSPGTARKRPNEEVYEKSERPLPSTTPLKTPPKLSFSHRISTEPCEQSERPLPSRTPLKRTPILSFSDRFPAEPSGSSDSKFSRVGFKDLESTQTPRPSATMDPPSAANAATENNPSSSVTTFVGAIVAYRTRLEDEFKDYENELKGRDRSLELENLDWEDLEARYQREIGLKLGDEEHIMKEISDRFNQFMLWMQVSGSRESERGIKRLRTRVTFVQNSEDQLDRRQEHYGKVLGAFQSAMALLGNV